ncbi:MAG: Fur-regulated basic protein FbpA [Sporolactobacillus sp.]
MAVERRKSDLIHLLQQHQVTNEPRDLKNWTLSELEHEWKCYQEQCARGIS